MEEKILIKSEFCESGKKVFRVIMCIILGLAAIMFIAAWGNINGFLSIVELIICGSLLVLAMIVYFIYWIYSCCELVVTERNVKGKTTFGKAVVLPLNQISAYSTRRFMSVISVATSSGVTKFCFIGNYLEIEKVLAKKIEEIQGALSSKADYDKSSVDDIMKFKELLDAGVISQEEFDIKKKQLLDL